MKHYLLTTLISLSLLSCSSMSLSNTADAYQAEMTIHKLRADIEEMKHDLHANKMGLNIIEGKIVNHEDTVTALKRDTLEEYLAKLETAISNLEQVQAKLDVLEKRHQSIERAMAGLMISTDEITKSIKQSKEKFTEIDGTLAGQRANNSEIARLKKNLRQISALIDTPLPHLSTTVHRVKSGESLEAIAKQHEAEVTKIKEINLLISDQIKAGQSLLIPLSPSE